MRSRKWWLKLHKFVGLYSVVFIFILTLSGLVLSFSDLLKLEDRTMFTSSQVLSIEANAIRLEADKIVINSVNTNARCIAPIVGVADLTQATATSESNRPQGLQSMMVVCQNIIYWMSWDGDIYDSINIPNNILPILNSYYQEDVLFVSAADKKYYWDMEKTELLEALQFEEKSEQLPQLNDKRAMTTAQFVLNLHTGLIAGDLGRYLMRLAALGLLLLCISGIKNALFKK